MCTKIEYDNFTQAMRCVELYVENNSPIENGHVNRNLHIWDYVTWLKNALRKKIARGNFTPSVEHLANSSTMKKIIREGERVLKFVDEMTLNSNEREQLRYYFAEMIIDDLNNE